MNICGRIWPRHGQRAMTVPQLFVATIVLLIVVIVLGGSLWFRFFTDTAKAEREKKAIEAKYVSLLSEQSNATWKATAALARNQQEQLLQTVRHSTNLLADLLTVVDHLESDLAALKTNEMGRTLSPHPDIVAQARRMYEDEARDVPPLSAVVQRLEGARRVEQQLLSTLGSAYSPDASEVSVAQETVFWAATKRQSADQFDALLSSLEREAKAKVLLHAVADPPTLEEAIQRVSAAEARARNEIITQETSAAKADAAKREAQGEAAVILARGEARKTEKDIDSQHILDDAQKKLFREKAARPDIQRELAAFLSPGYFMPVAKGHLQGEMAYDKKPMSYSVLRECGALKPTMDGLRTFVDIGSNPRNDRPRLTHRLGLWWNNPQYLEEGKNVQQLMIELGPTFVEMGLMQP